MSRLTQSWQQTVARPPLSSPSLFSSPQEGLSFEKALESVYQHRSVGPNPGFTHQLQLFEKMSCTIDKKHPEFRSFCLNNITGIRICCAFRLTDALTQAMGSLRVDCKPDGIDIVSPYILPFHQERYESCLSSARLRRSHSRMKSLKMWRLTMRWHPIRCSNRSQRYGQWA